MRGVLRLFSVLVLLSSALVLGPSAAAADSPTDTFQITFADGVGPVKAGDAHNYTVTALSVPGGAPDTGFAGLVTITCSADCQVNFEPTLAAGVGDAVVTMKTAGSQTLTATDNNNSENTGTSDPMTVTPAAAEKLIVVAPGSTTVNDPFSVTVTAKDHYNNTDVNYGGQVTFTSTDGGAIEPSDYTFDGGDNGVHVFSNAFKLMHVGSGTQTVTATDTGDGSITGTSGEISVAMATPTLVWTSTPPNASGPTDPGSTTVGASDYHPVASSASPIGPTYSIGASTACEINAGVVSFVALGTCTIDADQAGNGDWNGASTSGPQTIVVAIDTTTTTLSRTLGSGPSTFGDLLTFKAHVVSTGGGTPNGSVTFYDGASPLGTQPLVGGDASYSTSTLGGGPHTLTADYTGTAYFAGSTSSDFIQTVNRANPTLAWASTPPGAGGPAGPGATTVGAPDYNVVAGSASPGAVTYSLHAGSTGCSLTVDVISFLNPGSCKIDASQAATADWNAAVTSASQTTVISKASTTTSLTSDTNPSTFGGPVTFTAHVASASSITPTGVVEFFDGASSLGTRPLSFGDASYITSALGGGSHPITATFQGTTDFTASTSSPALNQVVDLATPATDLSSNSPSTILNASVTFTVHVTSSAGTPTGSVQFYDGASLLATRPLSGGSASTSTALLTLGHHSITVHYLGDSNFAAVTSGVWDQEITGNAQSTTTVVSGLNPSNFGDSVTFTAHATGAGPTPTGNVEFWDGLNDLGTQPLNGSGQASLSTSALGGGHHSITAEYLGDASYAGSTSSVLDQVVNKITPILNFTSTMPGPGVAVVGGATYLVSATSANVALPVTFAPDASAANVCHVNVNVVSYVGVGQCIINANQAGDANYNSPNQIQQSFAVGKGTPAITFGAAPASPVVGGTTYTVTATSPSPGVLTYTIDALAASICSISGGTTVSFTAAGNCVIDGNQAADTNWNVAPQAQTSFEVGKGTSVITFTGTPPATGIVGSTYTVTATSTATDGIAVTFTIDASTSANCHITGAALVNFDLAGNCKINANQIASTNWLAAVQVQLMIPVGSAGAPSKPGKPIGVAYTNTAVVSWAAPSTDGGAPITAYHVTSTVGGKTCNTSVGTTCTVTGLTAHTTYRFTVTATNGGGQTGPASDTSDAVLPRDGNSYIPLTPNRVFDTNAHPGSSLTHHSPVTFPVINQFPGDPTKNVPATATAITGVLTSSHSNAAGYFSLTPNPVLDPTTSTLNFPSGDSRSTGVTVPLSATGTLSITLMGTAGKTAEATLDITGYFVLGSSAAPDVPGAGYAALTPNRLLDSRGSNGSMSGGLTAGTHRTFQVTNRVTSDGNKNVPSWAVAVTGTLTVTGQTKPGYLYLGPELTDAPSTASLYFPLNDNRATGITVKLGTNGVLSLVYLAPAGAKTQVIFDVTGFFLIGTSGALYMPVTPNRIVDSRVHLGLAGNLKAYKGVAFPVTGRSADPLKNIPAGASAVTGILTVTAQTAAGYFSLTKTATNSPTTSTLNFPKGDTRATGVTVPLGSGKLGVCYAASPGTMTAAVIFDVSGYFIF